jgi:hypothetical protein
VRRLWGAVPGVVVALTLAGCGGSSPSSDASATRSVTPSSTPVPKGYPSDAPTGQAYTEPGSDLTLGEAAIVAWQPPGAAAGTASVPASASGSSSAPASGSATTTTSTAAALRITVTAIRPTTYAESFRDWKVSDALKTSAPYFVKATVTNLSTAGTADLGGLAVPLYGETAADTLVEASTFASTFKPCAPGTFPKKFAPGATAEVCLVYLVPDHGTLTGVTFRPSIDFKPIRWATPAALLPTGSASVGSTPSASGTIGVTPTPSATMSR